LGKREKARSEGVEGRKKKGFRRMLMPARKKKGKER